MPHANADPSVFFNLTPDTQGIRNEYPPESVNVQEKLTVCAELIDDADTVYDVIVGFPANAKQGNDAATKILIYKALLIIVYIYLLNRLQ